MEFYLGLVVHFCVFHILVARSASGSRSSRDIPKALGLCGAKFSRFPNPKGPNQEKGLTQEYPGQFAHTSINFDILKLTTGGKVPEIFASLLSTRTIRQVSFFYFSFGHMTIFNLLMELN